ncbi:Transcription initiation factor TFIID subunit 9 [Zea mays]|uniref:Transcription initiation factor TFIID subunit 9 n=1 Tax=Zea mays TaxID=4577 RepID=A0A1D6FCA2_MAIZE|nr:Transcription initiation factor TFIID subunit 9 [Zea mays]
MDAAGARPSAPSAAAAAVVGASVADEPRDARVVRELLRSMGLGEGEYEPRVVHQFLDLAYRYVGDVLGDAQVYADHVGKAQIDANDVRLAIQAKVNFSFSQPPPREVNDAIIVGDKLVSCSSDTTIKVWNCFSDGACTRTLHRHSDYVICLAAAENNSNIVASGGLGGEVFIWDLDAALAPVAKSVDAKEDEVPNGNSGPALTTLCSMNSSSYYVDKRFL